MPNQTRASIDIAAPPAVILAVIADFPNYPDWVDSISRAEVLTHTEDGRPHTVRMVLDHSVASDEVVLSFAWTPTAVHWQLVQANLLSAMDGSYELVPADGTTRVTYRLGVDVRLPLIGLLKRQVEKSIVDGALRGLKKRVEG